MKIEMLATGIFCIDSNVEYAAYPNAGTCKACSTGEQFGVQFIGAIVIFSWTAVTTGILFKVIDITLGMRVPEEIEDVGMDASEHGFTSANGNSVFPYDTQPEPIKTVTVSSDQP